MYMSVVKLLEALSFFGRPSKGWRTYGYNCISLSRVRRRLGIVAFRFWNLAPWWGEEVHIDYMQLDRVLEEQGTYPWKPTHEP
jgi:hypothetical protein